MKRIVLSIFTAGLILLGCGESQNKETAGENTQAPRTVDPMQDKGVGPVKNLVLPAEIDQELVAKGSEIFIAKCTACHKPDKKYIGPAPAGILERRTPEWIMNMILNPDKMIVENEIAKQLLIEYNGSPMANQNLTEEEARAILEYFRTLK
jgi:mono/diheme cytochrome c family protein